MNKSRCFLASVMSILLQMHVFPFWHHFLTKYRKIMVRPKVKLVSFLRFLLESTLLYPQFSDILFRSLESILCLLVEWRLQAVVLYFSGTMIVGHVLTVTIRDDYASHGTAKTFYYGVFDAYRLKLTWVMYSRWSLLSYFDYRAHFRHYQHFREFWQSTAGSNRDC